MTRGNESLKSRQVHWAHEYDGYVRLAGGPHELSRLLEPAWAEFQRGGAVPQWCGVDLLRGWAFYLVRADRHSGGGNLTEDGPTIREWDAVLEAIAGHPCAQPADLPPLR